jgi:hypothetical protein
MEQIKRKALWSERVLRAVLSVQIPMVFIALKISLVLGLLEEMGLLIY